MRQSCSMFLFLSFKLLLFWLILLILFLSIVRNSHLILILFAISRGHHSILRESTVIRAWLITTGIVISWMMISTPICDGHRFRIHLLSRWDLCLWLFRFWIRSLRREKAWLLWLIVTDGWLGAVLILFVEVLSFV